MPTAQFPYTFAARKADFQRSLPPFHDKLTENRCDIAFEVEWTALSPVAANPCSDSGPSSAPENNPKSYAGYDKRWLTVGGKLALSPFTVKSAIANGFANLLGGCYRVNSEVVSHAPVEPGQYPYAGKYKRYRVGMDGQSKPGVIKNIVPDPSTKTHQVEIKPVTEYYLDSKSAKDATGSVVTLEKGKNYIANWEHPVKMRRGQPERDRNGNLVRDPHKRIILTLDGPFSSSPSKPSGTPVVYYGEYKFGRDLELKAEDLGKKHYHRFYEESGSSVIKGSIPEVNFMDSCELKKKVYLGSFKRVGRLDNRPEGTYWHENLSKIRNGSFVYYENQNGEVTNIGQNYLFKALFCHSDTIPPGQETCNVRDNLCPRCQMYGITTESENREVDAGGYRGRFKASALVSADILDPEEKLQNQRIPHEDFRENFTNVDLLQWKSGGKLVARQFLMPIAGPPKPNKRDVNGYFNPRTGFLKGPKKYRHGSFGVTNLQEWGQQVATLNQKTDRNPETRNFNYSHKLRNYAMVCESGTSFKGTVGAENCSPDEAAALLMLLETGIAGHGFKIGLGKSWGLGSVASVINKIWIRTAESDCWEPIPCNEKPIDLAVSELVNRLKDDNKIKQVLKNITEALQVFKSVQDINKKINSVEEHTNRKLQFPESLRNYWTTANNTGLNG